MKVCVSCSDSALFPVPIHRLSGLVARCPPGVRIIRDCALLSLVKSCQSLQHGYPTGYPARHLHYGVSAMTGWPGVSRYDTICVSICIGETANEICSICLSVVACEDIALSYLHVAGAFSIRGRELLHHSKNHPLPLALVTPAISFWGHIHCVQRCPMMRKSPLENIYNWFIGCSFWETFSTGNEKSKQNSMFIFLSEQCKLYGFC